MPSNAELEGLRADLDAPQAETADQLLERASERAGRQLFTVPQARAALAQDDQLEAAGGERSGGVLAAQHAHVVPHLTPDEELAIHSLRRLARRWPPSLMLWGGGARDLRVMKGHPEETQGGCLGCTVAWIRDIPHDGGDPENVGPEPSGSHGAKPSAEPTTRRGRRHVG